MSACFPATVLMCCRRPVHISCKELQPVVWIIKSLLTCSSKSLILVQLSYCFVLRPLVVQGLSVVKMRVDAGIDQAEDTECKPLADQRMFENRNKLKCLDYVTCSIKGYDCWITLQDTLCRPQICDRDDSTLSKEHYLTDYDTSFLPD